MKNNKFGSESIFIDFIKSFSLSSLLSVIFFILLLSSVVSASSWLDLFASYASNIPSWTYLLGAAFLLGFSLAAIAYMISSVFHLPQLNVWAKQEFAEMTATAFLVVIALLSIQFSESIFFAATGERLTATTASFLDTARDNLMSAYQETHAISFVLGFFSGMPMQYRPPSEQKGSGSGSDGSTDKKGLIPVIPIPIVNIVIKPGLFGAYPYSGTTPILMELNRAQGTLFNSVLLAVVAQVVQSFAIDFSISFFIPFGVLLSCFVLTRKVGRTMIALGLVLYIFVSVSFMVTKEMYNFVPKVSRPTSKLSGASMGDPSEILEPWLGPFSDEYVKKCFNCLTSGSSLSKAKCAVKLPFCIITNLIKWIRDLILSIKELFEVLATVVGSSLATMYAGPLGLEASKVADRSIVADAADLYSDSIPWIMCYAVPMFLFPVILFAIVATAGKAIAQAIGGEVDMVSVMLLV